MPTFRQYLQESPGTPLQDIWAYQPYTRGVLHDTDQAIDEDVRWIPRQGSGERLGYATQKPEGLLERVIRASSSEGDVVLDPFCGCGTAVAAAHKLGRQWVGIDITHLAVALMKNRLKTAFNLEAAADYEVVGEPQDEGSARALWEQDPYQFQFWTVSLLEAQPQSAQRRGAELGVSTVYSTSLTAAAARPTKGGDTGQGWQDFITTSTRPQGRGGTGASGHGVVYLLGTAHARNAA